MLNLFSAIKEREFGFFTSPKINIEKSKSFTQDVFGSRFLTQRMEHKYFLIKQIAPIACLTFNCGGDLLCTTFGDRKLLLYDWEFNKVHTVFTSRHFNYGSKIKCLKSNASEFEIISTGYDRILRRASVVSCGNLNFSTIFVSPDSALRFTLVPGDINEVILASSKGDIFTIDLRRPPHSYSNSITTVKHTSGNNLSTMGIIHHPFYPEICVYGEDNVMHIYDKRNYRDALKKICLGNPDRKAKIYNCSYNYNGSEFLAQGVPYATCLVKNNNNGDIIRRFTKYRSSCFFGPKSTHIILNESDGYSPRLTFYDTNTGELVKIASEDKDDQPSEFRICTLDPEILLPHPKLPVIAYAAGTSGVSIFSPPNIFFRNKYKLVKLQ